MGCGRSGYFADKSHRHWAFAFLGYTINMLAVPALALTRQWPLAASLVVSERIGRGIRKPTVEAMLSYAGRSIGAGWVFGLNEALDELTIMDPQQAQIVELKFFGGLSIEETAEVLGISHATVERDWKMARAWLRRQLE